MGIKRVIFIKTNLIDRDERMQKETAALKRKGYVITLLTWDRDRKISNHRLAKILGYEEICLRCKAPWGIKILPLLPIWWCFVFYQLMVNNWDIAHVINFDSIVSASIVGKLKRKPIIYEILDTYEDETKIPTFIRNISIKIDKLFIGLATSVILVDELQIREFGGISKSSVVTIYDSPPNVPNNVTINYHKNEIFTIYYTGRFDKARRMNLDKIISAIKAIDNVRFVISGQGDQIEEIQNWATSMPTKITFLGFITNEEVLKWTDYADLLLVARTPTVIGNKYNCGSTILRALMFGKPFIANKGTATADLVCREHCGIVVDAYDIDDIIKSIMTLRDNPSLVQEFGKNAKIAYEKHYKWEIMEQRLIDLYDYLLKIK